MSFLLEAFEAKDTDGFGNAVFTTITRGEQVSNYRRMGDPSLEQIFKRIFSFGHPIRGVKGEDRIRSLLNSFFYPNASETDAKIRAVVPLPLEVGIFQVACRCSCWSDVDPDKVETFDVLLQTGFNADYSEISFRHSRLCQSAQEQCPVRILAFLNHQWRDEDEFSWRNQFYEELKDRDPTIAEGVIDARCVILSTAVEILRENDAIEIKGKELGTVGREWLKLLSMRFWASKDGKWYLVPENSASDGAVNSALAILECVTEEELSAYIWDEKYGIDVCCTALEDRTRKGIERGAREGKQLLKKVRAQRRFQQETIDILREALALGFDFEEIAEAMEMSVSDLTKAVSFWKRGLMSRRQEYQKLWKSGEGRPEENRSGTGNSPTGLQEHDQNREQVLD
jgi:DNA-binding transcriptional MerR regulator